MEVFLLDIIQKSKKLLKSKIVNHYSEIKRSVIS